jgi:hypothetical protein
LEAELFVDFVYIDTEERKRFAQTSHEYLIQQVQFTGDEIVRSSSSGVTPNRVNLNFNHPCKELIWVVSDPNEKFKYTFDQPQKEITGSTSNILGDLADDGILNGTFDASNVRDHKVTHNEKILDPDDNTKTLREFTDQHQHQHTLKLGSAKGPVSEANIQLNGHDRFVARPGSYFNLVQPYQHHTNVPKNKGIYCYSFALEPESEQPTGSCNMSRIDNAVLNLKLDSHEGSDSTKTHNLKVFATNFNVLRIMGGMGGIAFAN